MEGHEFGFQKNWSSNLLNRFHDFDVEVRMASSREGLRQLKENVLANNSQLARF